MIDGEYYPTLDEVLRRVAGEIVLVGSATKRPLIGCKDIDFVISQKGYDILTKDPVISLYICKMEDGWLLFFSEDYPKECVVEFFLKKCDILDKRKWDNRITYDETIELNLKVVPIGLSEVFSL